MSAILRPRSDCCDFERGSAIEQRSRYGNLFDQFRSSDQLANATSLQFFLGTESIDDAQSINSYREHCRQFDLPSLHSDEPFIRGENARPLAGKIMTVQRDAKTTSSELLATV